MNKKHIIILIATILIGINASAQFKINAGYINSKETAKAGGIKASINGNGFFAGFLYDIKTSDFGLSFEPGINFDYISFKVLGESSAVYYLRTPLHVNYKYDLSDKVALFVGAGPSVIVGIGGEDEPFGDGGLNRIDLQIGALAGVRLFDHLEIRAGYDWGLLKAEDVDVKNHRNALTVGLAYSF